MMQKETVFLKENQISRPIPGIDPYNQKENNLQYRDFIALHASSTRLSFDDWIRSGTFLV